MKKIALLFMILLFLDNAIYPVTVDPNFGYETKGASTDDNIYWLVHESQYDFFRSYYDSGGTNQEAYESSHTFDTWPDNPTGMVYYYSTVAIYPQVLILECRRDGKENYR